MQVSVTGHHVEVTDSLRNHVEEKMGKIKRHFDNVTNVHVILTVEKLEQKAEATVQISGAKLFADEYNYKDINYNPNIQIEEREDGIFLSKKMLSIMPNVLSFFVS